ncbi:hypothetical protein HNR42_002052 [Deinobacterium chartae]|uniref:Sucrase ferredoxin n=1 Tax=Deinobacterium chartae TaxID=521158 RepID=A0A841HYZ9_9DEIO|nr:sucrase ferredoxin [Deinobacterium chartae]MBB6098617.1 hypothetical protein [Deinobacterium chartae]
MSAPNPSAPPRLRLCSVEARRSGEDPIGSALPWQHGFVLELPVGGWDRYRDTASWSERRKAAYTRLGEYYRRTGHYIGQFMAQTDHEPEGGRSGPWRVRHYARPGGQTHGYLRQDYRLDEATFDHLLEALSLDPLNPDLSALARWRIAVPVRPGHRDFHVCTHGRVDAACGKFGFPFYRWLQDRLGDLEGRAWRTSHFGGHHYAPTLVELPSGRAWAWLDPAITKAILQRQGPITAVLGHYRGRSTLDRFAQHLEREGMRLEGWNWFDFRVDGHTVQTCGGRDPEWATARLQFTRPDGTAGRLEGRFERAGEVQTLLHSGGEFGPVTQYRLAHLEVCR